MYIVRIQCQIRPQSTKYLPKVFNLVFFLLYWLLYKVLSV